MRTTHGMFSTSRHRFYPVLTLAVTAMYFASAIPNAWADKLTDGLQVFVLDGQGAETDVTQSVTFDIDGDGGKGTRVTVKFSDASMQVLVGRTVLLKRGGVTIARSVLKQANNTDANPADQGQQLTDAEKQLLLVDLENIHQSETDNLQTLHQEELLELNTQIQAVSDDLNDPGLTQEQTDSLTAQLQDLQQNLQTAMARHEQDNLQLESNQSSELNNVQTALFGGGPNPGGLTATTIVSELTPGSDIASSIARQARGKFSDFNNLPVNPLPPGTPANGNAPINRQQEDALQEIVRAVFVIGHFDKVEQDTSNLWAGAPGGAAQPAGGRRVKDFPTPEETDEQGNVYHPAITNGGSNVRFQKWVQELPRVPVFYPVDISPGLLNTEELRRAYSPARWGAVKPGQVYHGIAPEYWQHASDWEQHPTLFFERDQNAGLRDVLGIGIQTPLWGYADGGQNADPLGPGSGNISVPGACFIGRFAEPFVVRDLNLLAHKRGTHLHGAHSPAHSDGSPHFFINSGQARDYYYPNIPPRAHDANLLILNEAAASGISYEEAAAQLNIPLYVSRPGPAPEGDDPPNGWPNEFDGTPARVNRNLGPLGGVAGSQWEMPDMTDTNWYHDHAMDETGPGAYSGLAGYYMTTDPTSEELMRRNIIPTFYPRTGEIAPDGSSSGLDFDPMKRGNPDTDYGTYFQILSSADKIVNSDGTLFYDVLSHDGQMGDVMLTNGAANPVMHVENRKYRFHCHGAGSARAWYMKLRDENYNTVSQFMQIGYDAWFYEKPIMMDGLLLFASKRRDVIIDFGELYARGIREVYYENCLPQIDGRGPRGTADLKQVDEFTLQDGERGERMVKFIITDEPIHGGKPDLNIDLNTPLRENVVITADEVVKTRILSFKRHNGAWSINNTFYDRSVGNFVPTIGTAERWIIRNNGGGWWHPIHIHLEAHQWQKINGATPHPSEHLHKQDTTVLGSNDEVEVFIKFRTWLGPFVFHCHNLEHEDMRMMFNIDPVLFPTESPQFTQNLFP